MWAHDICFKFELYKIIYLIYLLKLWYFVLDKHLLFPVSFLNYVQQIFPSPSL